MAVFEHACGSTPDRAVVEEVAPRSWRWSVAPASPSPARGRDGRTLAPPDVATCAACLAELPDPADRRYRYPFINCTELRAPLHHHHGAALRPAVDHDGRLRDVRRPAAAEYDDPADRRFHAQPIGCPDCGPRLTLHSSTREAGARATDAALAARAPAARRGGIVAVKGIGGYHLACDASDEAAVAELRRRKQRGTSRSP